MRQPVRAGRNEDKFEVGPVGSPSDFIDGESGTHKGFGDLGQATEAKD